MSWCLLDPRLRGDDDRELGNGVARMEFWRE
jgi:hypothetical protein